MFQVSCGRLHFQTRLNFRHVIRTLSNHRSHVNSSTAVPTHVAVSEKKIFCRGYHVTLKRKQRRFCSTHGNLETKHMQMETQIVQKVYVKEDGKILEVVWKDGTTSRYHSIWLRFACRCNTCWDHDSNACKLNIAGMPLSVNVECAEITETGDIKLQFDEEGHCSEYSSLWLKENCYSPKTLISKRDAIRPQFSFDGTIPKLHYSEVIDSEEGQYRWLKFINERGLCLITDTPTKENYCNELMQLIGPVMNTSYGPVLEAVHEDKPYNMANTDNAMEYHMDLPQYESAPGIQSLHCVRFDKEVTGGDTFFLDILHVAEEFQKDYPEEFSTLTTVPATFMRIHYARSDPVHHISQRPLIMVDSNKRIVSVKWNPHLNGSLCCDQEFVEPFYRAYVLFARQISNSPTKMKIRLAPGDFITFNNRRMAHCRTAFQHGENRKRLLQTSYVNIDDYASKLRILYTKFGDTTSIKWIGNNNWI